jgi:hypothetical protein
MIAELAVLDMNSIQDSIFVFADEQKPEDRQGHLVAGKEMQQNTMEFESAQDLAGSLRNAGNELIIVGFLSPLQWWQSCSIQGRNYNANILLSFLQKTILEAA